MTERTQFEMSEDDLEALMDASKPTPVMYLSGGTPMFNSPQENANAAWARLGEKMGFKPMTVRPVAGKGQRVFTAEPVEATSDFLNQKPRTEAQARAQREDGE